MSSEIEEKSSFRLPESLVPAQIIQKTQKQPELLYSRDFLLSLRDLDICTELPSGFDESVLCEFLSVSNNTSEQQRNPTGLKLVSLLRLVRKRIVRLAQVVPRRGFDILFCRKNMILTISRATVPCNFLCFKKDPRFLL